MGTASVHTPGVPGMGWRFVCDTGGPKGWGCGFAGPARYDSAPDKFDSWRAVDQDKFTHFRTCKPELPDDIPDLEFPPPVCSVCEEDLEYEECWTCYRCCITWSNNGSKGEVDQDMLSEDLDQ